MAKTVGGIRGSGRVRNSITRKVMTEEEYLASKGYGSMGFGDVALAKGNYRNRSGRAILQRQNQKDTEYFNKRASLRDEYKRKVALGEISQPSRNEQLIKTARGNSDNEAVRAARRALEKRGVNWRRK